MTSEAFGRSENNNMFRRDRQLTCSLLLLLSLGTFADEGHAASSDTVHFANSCGEQVRERFDHGITMLHSFEYPETTRIFGSIIDEHPDCAMAYWGAAMSIWHPLWAPPSVAELENGARLLAATNALEAAPRERAYLDAMSTFFSSMDPATHAERAHAYADAMGRLYAQYHATDPEAAVFYALALLASADPRDKTYSQQFRAAGLLNWVRESQPEHPGVLHYLIHSYDFPGLAHLALSAAMIYAEAAPDSAHAQHMPSHIFTRLGLWDRSLASNHDSTRSAAEYTERANLPGHYDEGLHSIDYLMYAMLQTARDDEAAELLDRLADIDRTDTENFKVAYTYASTPARYALERRAWDEAANLQFIREDFAWDEFGFARSIHHFARGIGAARSGQLDAAKQEVKIISAIQREMPPTTLTYWREQVQVHIDAISAWIDVAEGNVAQGLERAKAAADLEDAVDKHPVTPGEVLPSRELYADLLYEVGRPVDALREYVAVLNNSPNRLNGLRGAAAAAAASSQKDIAEQFRAIIRDQIRDGSGPRAQAAD